MRRIGGGRFITWWPPYGPRTGRQAGSRLSVDVALFGRMLAVMPEKNQYAACQVAHAISTHAVEREFDFFTAVDDLKPEDTAGADMMGTVEFNSACFYRYAMVDWAKLGNNLQGDAELSAKGLRAFLEGFVVAEPTGKQNTFAAHNPPEFIMVTVRRNTAPRNLANAFESALRARDGLTRTSASALMAKAKALQVASGVDAFSALHGVDAGEGAALMLALERRCPALVDERRGRRVATELGIPLVGTLGVLLHARLSGQIEQLAPLLAALDQFGYRLSPRLTQAVLQRAGEA